jgi:two-component system cell cycle sensor histidine kinase/response regulator CckA
VGIANGAHMAILMDDAVRKHLRYVRIGMVLLVSAGFLWVSIYLRNWTEHNIFPILFPAVAVSAWLGGRLGGLISTAALSLGTAYFHFPPAGFAIDDPADLVRLGTFSISGAFVAWLSGALKESQGIMMATLHSIGDAVIATDSRGKIRFLNPVAEGLTGWSQRDAHGRPLIDVFQSIYADTGAPVQLPPAGTVHHVLALDNAQLISKSGERIPIDDSFASVQLKSGRMLGSILVFRDATKRKQSEAALLESQRQRLQAQRIESVGRLAGGIAHDFNNLLTVINGYADMVLKETDAESAGRSSILEIRKAGERAASLTRQLLVFSRGQRTTQETADLNTIVAEFEKMLRRLIGEDIQLITRLADTPLIVQVDVGQIEQVIMNLAVNARDAMPRGGQLSLTTEVRRLVEIEAGTESAGPDRYAVLSVTDTGSGIDEQTRSHLFEPFFTTKDVGKGTGLGLAVLYRIVQNHNGLVKVSSQPGEGSTFEVYLPLTQSRPEAAPAAATILLVEGDTDVRTLVRDVVARLEYRVLEATDGHEAILIAGSHGGPIDLLVADVVIPGFSVFELARRLTAIRPTMKVLYLSSYNDQEASTTASRHANVAYLRKPFTLADLASRIQTMLSQPKAPSAIDDE